MSPWRDHRQLIVGSCLYFLVLLPPNQKVPLLEPAWGKCPLYHSCVHSGLRYWLLGTGWGAQGQWSQSHLWGQLKQWYPKGSESPVLLSLVTCILLVSETTHLLTIRCLWTPFPAGQTYPDLLSSQWGGPSFRASCSYFISAWIVWKHMWHPTQFPLPNYFLRGLVLKMWAK